MPNPNKTYKEFGNFEVQLLPDYKFSHNGYGLCTLTANFQLDAWEACRSDTSYFMRGAPLIGGVGEIGKAIAKQSWTCVRADETGREGNIVIVTATYAAISNGQKGGCTETEATITSAVVSEPIEAHPNFSRIQIEAIGSGKPLGGIWTGDTPPAPNDEEKNKYRAAWGPLTTIQAAGVVSYNFLGFLPHPANETKVNRKAGVRSWMRPTITMRLTGYTDSKEQAIKASKKTWWVTKDGVEFLKIPDMYKEIAKNDVGFINFDVSDKRVKEQNWLVTSCNTEVYGGLYKVTADLLLSGVAGWDADIYPYMYAV